MKLLSTKEKFDLSNESIDIISQKYFDLLTELKYEKRNKMAIRLNIENNLLSYQEKFGKDTEITLSVASRIGTPSITIEIKGEEYNPQNDDNTIGDWNNVLIQNMSVIPNITYFNNTNYIQLKLKKPTINPIIKLLLSLAVGGALAGIGFMLPNDTRALILENWLTPIYNAFLGVLSFVGLSLVLLSSVSGIIEAGDISTFSKIGKRLVSTLLGFNALILLISGASSIGFFNLSFSSSANGKSQISEIFKLLLEILPNNIIAPFSNGNALQIMVIGIAIGIAILALGDTTKALGSFFNQMFSVAIFIMEFIEKLLPIFISIVVMQIAWSSEVGEVVGMWKLFVIVVAMCVVIMAVAIIFTSLRNKISPAKLIKKMMPTFLLALSTASAAAVHGTCVECCEGKFGIDKKLSIFGVSFSTGIYKPATAMLYFVTSLYLAEQYKIDVSIMWLITAFAICYIMSIATPPVAGGTAIAYTILFLQLGIPTKALAVILAINIVFEFIIVATDKVLICTSLLNLASKNNLVNTKKLHK